MTDAQIKEAISRHFIELVVNRSGFTCFKPEPDQGVDLTVNQTMEILRNGRTRHLQGGKYVDLQLKCTCESQVQREANGLKYDLEAKAYNDLIVRRDSGIAPLILVLLVLPDNSDEWITVTPDELIVRRCAYWFVPPAGAEETNNTETVRIMIPFANAIGLSFVEDRFREAYP
jgi:hypothetical protein